MSSTLMRPEVISLQPKGLYPVDTVGRAENQDKIKFFREAKRPIIHARVDHRAVCPARLSGVVLAPCRVGMALRVIPNAVQKSKRLIRLLTFPH
jgi:hypothetical protein